MNNCPRCNSLLENKISKKIKYELCTSCDGILIYEDQINKMAKLRNQSETLKKSNKKPISDLITVKCPACTGNFIQIRLNNIVIDKCKDCNLIWLDGGELEKYVEHILIKKNLFGKSVSSEMSDFIVSEIIFNLIGEGIGAILENI